MFSSPLLVSHVQFGEPSQCLASRVGKRYQHTSTSFPSFPRPLLPKLRAPRSDSPKSLLSTPGTPVVYEGKSCLGSQFVASPPLCVQLLQSVSSSPFPTLTGVGETWFQTPLDPNEAGREVSVSEIPVKDPGEMQLCTFLSNDPLFLQSPSPLQAAVEEPELPSHRVWLELTSLSNSFASRKPNSFPASFELTRL